ncbi:MAG: SagB/ThcOx family dehydrogenase [Tannerella sp.]|jgi:SagB-type dehydrogenase family enzyme|nr:SagB/ThcOx family dehydrogenase [Tannerella sp.]
MNTKKTFIALVTCLTAIHLHAQELQVIKLTAPDKTRGSATMKAFSDRHSDREFSARELSLQDLSDLLWAANGINRADGKRTAPSAMNKQEIDIYAIRPDGAYVYDAKAHALNPVAKGDYRAAVAGTQEFVKSAPVSFVMVINLEKLGDPAVEQTRLMGAVDAGIVSQNINLFCAAVGLSTVPRASMDQAELRNILKLSPTQLPLMNNPVGYPKK